MVLNQKRAHRSIEWPANIINLRLDPQKTGKKQHHHNQDKNMLIAARLYISRCITNVLQNYSRLELKEAVDLTLIQRFLENNKYENTLRYFFDESFTFKQEIKDKIIEYYNGMIQMHKRGIFTVIYLNELLSIGNVKYPTTQWMEIKNEMY